MEECGMKYDVKGTGLVVVTVDADSEEEAKRLVKEKFGDIKSYKLDGNKYINICTEIEFND